MAGAARRRSWTARLALGAAASGLILSLAAPAQAQGQGQASMSVASYLARVQALKAKGIAALFSPELKTLQAIGAAAGAEYRARLAQERAAGRPSSCPPAKTKVSSDQFLAHLESYPAPVRERTTLVTAVGDMFARTWPCR